MKILISYALFGDDEKYTKGALHNAKVCRESYGRLGEVDQVFWVGNGAPKWVVDALEDYGATVILKGGETGWGRVTTDATVARFFAADLGADAFFCRDTDSRPSNREVDAMLEWQRSGKAFHVMRDHPYHYAAVMGGMWGGFCAAFQNTTMQRLFLDWKLKNSEPEELYGYNQRFLKESVWPVMAGNVLQHDTFYREYSGGVPFPGGDSPGLFVGEVVDEKGEFNQEHREIREKALT